MLNLIITPWFCIAGERDCAAELCKSATAMAELTRECERTPEFPRGPFNSAVQSADMQRPASVSRAC